MLSYANSPNRIVLLLFAFLFHSFILFGGTTDTEQDLEKYRGMSLDELLALEINVASSDAKTVFQTPSTVSVITADMIRTYNFQTVAEALNTVAGFSTIRTAARIEMPTARWVLQDHYPNKVLVMVNGVPTWETNTGATTLGHVSVTDLERIEVLKGPASVLYGTNAFVGAINLVLKQPSAKAESGGELRAGAAENQGIRGGANYQLIQEDLTLFVAANSYDEDGSLETITDAEGVTGHYLDFRNYKNVSVSADYSGHSILFNSYSEHQSKLGKDPTFADALGKPQNLYGYLIDYNYNFGLKDIMDVKAGFSFDYNHRRFPRAAVVAASESQYGGDVPTDEDLVSDVSGYRSRLYLKGHGNLSNNVNIDLGLEYEDRVNKEYRSYNISTNNLGSHNNMMDRGSTEGSVFGQIEYTRGSIVLLAGTRVTNNELFGVNTSSRATLVYSLHEKNSIKLNVGQAYRSPSLFELYFQNTSRSVNGNPDVGPERNVSYELAYTTGIGGFFAQALVYHSVYSDKIYRQAFLTAEHPDLVLVDGTRLGDTGRSSTKVYQNGEDFTANGLELETRFQFGRGGLFANYDYVHGDDGDDLGNGHYNFKYPPKHKLVSGLSLNLGSFDFSTVYTRYSEMQSVIGPIPSQYNVDFNLNYNHRLEEGKTIRHSVSIKNLTNDLVMGADYVDREETFPTLPWNQSRRISYTLAFLF